MISSIYLFEIVSAVMFGPKIFFSKAETVAYTTVVNPNGAKTLLANSVSTFFIIGKPTGLTDINDLGKISL